MTGSHATARQEAVGWAIRAHDAEFDDWEALEDWLAADPLHAELYDRVTITAEEAIGARPSEAPVATRRLARRPVRWLPFALAASIVIAAGGGWVYQRTHGPVLYALATLPGQKRVVALDGSVKMELDGDSRLVLDRRDPRFARLEQGGALFTVRHDPEHPFKLHVGEIMVTDIGTVFDVQKLREDTLVSVAEGEVRVTTPAGEIAVPPGRMISIGPGGATIIQREQDKSSVGAWRLGRIDFVDMRIDALAERLRRVTGAMITVSPDIAARRVSGSISVGSDQAATFKALAPLIDISVARHGHDWEWSGRLDASPS